MAEERFTENEVQEILRRAVEDLPSRGPGPGEGVSLAELRSIGAEVGIDPVHLEDAARAVAQRRHNRPDRLLGGPLSLRFERTVAGEIGPGDTPAIVSTIRRTLGQHGVASEVLGSLEWKADGEVTERHLSVWSRQGTTTVRASSKLSDLAFATYLPAAIVGFLSFLFVARGGTDIGLLLLLLIPILLPILRMVFARLSEGESARLEEVVEVVARLVEGTVDPD